MMSKRHGLRMAYAALMSLAMVSPTAVTAATTVVRCDFTATFSIYKNGDVHSTQPWPSSWRIYRIDDATWDSLTPDADDWQSTDCQDRCTITPNSFKDEWDYRQEDGIAGAVLYQRVTGRVTINRIDGSYSYVRKTDTYRTKLPDGKEWVRVGNTIRPWNGSPDDGRYGMDYRLEERKGKCVPTGDPLANRTKAF